VIRLAAEHDEDTVLSVVADQPRVGTLKTLLPLARDDCRPFMGGI